MTGLTARGIRKSFGRRQVLAGVDIEVAAGELVLLLDEPYQGFDWQTYLAFWELTGELRRRATAAVVISHLVFERERFDRICHLSGGRIHEEAGSHAATA